MSSYPSIEEYSNALQAAHNTIKDPKLAQGTVQTNNWGIPLARNGTFALTYKISAGGKDYAFRCFQRDRPGMHKRYTAISAALRKNSLPYFVTFDYLDVGITILTKDYPALVMQWAEGEPLGSFIEQNKSRPTKLKALRSQIEALGHSLEAAGIAHGDIQTNNIVVTDDGELRLVDYDGMFVPALASMGALEAGHKNFQHPEREALSPYDNTLDRFSLAVLHVGISALIEKPSLWNKLSGDPEALLLRAADFADPDNSEALQVLSALPGAGEGAQRLAAMSKAPYDKLPTFSDFLAGENIPTAKRNITSKPKASRSPSEGGGAEVPWYHEAAGTGFSQPAATTDSRYRILDASDLSACLAAAGEEVELIGQIKRVSLGNPNGLPFAHLRLAMDIESSPEVLIWFQGMRALDYIGQHPNESWKGQWVSATGVMSSRGDARTVTHPAIVIERANQFELLTPGQAKFRLNGGTTSAPANSAPQTNAEKLAGLGEVGKKAKASGAGSGFAGSSSSTGSPATASQNKTIGGLDRQSMLWILGILALIIGVIILIVASGNSTSSYEGGSFSDDSFVDTSMGENSSIPESASDASDQVGSCWSISQVKVECTSTEAAFTTDSWETSASNCPDGYLPWGDGNFLCRSPIEPALNPADYETCYTEEINGRNCKVGLSWTYSACWDRNDAVLEQKVAGTWRVVNADISAKSAEYCTDAKFPYLVEFTRKAAGPGTKQYSLYFPETEQFYSYDLPITVTVTEQ